MNQIKANMTSNIKGTRLFTEILYHINISPLKRYVDSLSEIGHLAPIFVQRGLYIVI